MTLPDRIFCSIKLLALLKSIRGAITTSLKSVVNHARKQIPKGGDETACRPNGRR